MIGRPCTDVPMTSSPRKSGIVEVVVGGSVVVVDVLVVDEVVLDEVVVAAAVWATEGDVLLASELQAASRPATSTTVRRFMNPAASSGAPARAGSLVGRQRKMMGPMIGATAEIPHTVAGEYARTAATS